MDIINRMLDEIRRTLFSISIFYNGVEIRCRCYNDDVQAEVWNGKTLRYSVFESNKVYRELKMIPKEVLESKLKEIDCDNQRFYNAKIRLIKLADKLFGHDAAKVVEFIDIVCTPYRYVGNGNRYYVDSNTQYRLADRTWWDICDGDLHLQKVITLDCGANLSHNYPDTSEEDILKEVMKIIKKG